MTERNLKIDDVWPVSTQIHHKGGIGVDWSGAPGFGQFVLYWGDDGKLYASTEAMANNEHKEFVREILGLLADQITVRD